MIRWTGLAPWEFEFPFPDSLRSTFLRGLNSNRFSHKISRLKRGVNREISHVKTGVIDSRLVGWLKRGRSHKTRRYRGVTYPDRISPSIQCILRGSLESETRTRSEHGPDWWGGAPEGSPDAAVETLAHPLHLVLADVTLVKALRSSCTELFPMEISSGARHSCSCFQTADVEQTRHIYDCQDQILALAFR